MKRTLTALSLALSTLPALADTPVAPEEFEARVAGRTLEYASGEGAPFGAEEYLENRRVRWTYFDGNCQEGRWYPAGDQVCFVYDDVPSPQCWRFYLRDGRLLARFENLPGATELYETRDRSGPLQCLGPEVGV